MLVKLAITLARIRPGSGWPARILAGILLVALAASVSPAPASAASPAPVPTPTVAHSRSGAKANVAVAPLEGLDVSRWQNTINWAQVKAAGKQFVVMKATEGTGYVDPMYSTNRAGAISGSCSCRSRGTLRAASRTAISGRFSCRRAGRRAPPRRPPATGA